MDIKNDDLSDLLRDVNHFLSETLRNETLSGSAEVEREELLKKMLPYSEIITPYIDMSQSSKKSSQSADYVPLHVNENQVESQLYEEFPDQALCYSPEESQPEVIIDYLILPASKLRKVGKKYGPLWRKEKFMGLFVERSIRCWVGILGDVLYIYGSDRDTKPGSFVNVQGFEARPAVTHCPKDLKKRDCCFELVCPGKKSLQFIACSVKDMEHWISCIKEASSQINNGSDIIRKRQLPSPPPSSKGIEEYDDIHPSNPGAIGKDIINEDKMYHNLKNLNLKDDSLMTSVLQHPVSKIFHEHELLYDDICGTHSSIYYNLTDKKIGQSMEDDSHCNRSKMYGYTDDEDIYDDIGISKTSEIHVLTNSNNDFNNALSHFTGESDVTYNSKNQVFIDMRDKLDSALEKSVNCPDNLYEPVDNPRKE